MQAPRILPFGEEAYVIESPAPANLISQQGYHRLQQHLLQKNWVRQIVTGFNNLTVFVDTSLIAPAHVITALEAAIATLAEPSDTPETTTRRLHRVPVRYSTETGADLLELANYAGVSVDQLIHLHTSQIYTVYCLGFLPGFAYLGDLPSALHCPRRAEPRLRVPAGSVAIGGSQTGIYPISCPGGWHLIGHTDLSIFDPKSATPCLFRAGDQVEFYAL